MNETQYIEQYIHGALDPEEKLLMDARCIMDAELSDKVHWQQKTYALVQQYGRKKLKMELEAIQQRLFSESRFATFRNKIKNIFTTP